MATNNSVDVGLSGSNGTVHFVGATSPTLTTPTLGAATATSIAFSPTTGGIIGTTAADNSSAGEVGEFISSHITSGSGVSLSNNTQATITSISLTAGDWDVFGNVVFIPAATTTMANSLVQAGLSSGAGFPSRDLTWSGNKTLTTGANQGLPVPTQRFNLSGTTTISLYAELSFAVSTMTACGGIYARRRR